MGQNGNKILRLVLRIYWDCVSKLNTASKLVQTIIIDRNSKEHIQNKVYQKELPQLKKYLSPLDKI